jgi:hypothetical protein
LSPAGASSGNSFHRADSSFASDGSEGVDNADASYSFSIDTDSYKRTEASDAKGNIRGQYSYSNQAGGNHGVSYIAGDGIGFVVTSSDSAAAADTRTNLNNDGSYSFSFSTNDQSRDESADSQNNVKGSYSFKAKDDGRTRHVDYTAGSATGFVATGSHLPVPPPPTGNTVLFGYSQGQRSPEPFGQSSSSFSQSGHSSSSATDGIQRRVGYTAGEREVSLAKDASSVGLTSGEPKSFDSFSHTAAGEGSMSSGPQGDGSFSFSYDAGDHRRQESGDAQNNVRGSYSFVAKDDGQTRRVEYEAGAATGFVAKGAHLPVAPNHRYSYSSRPSGSSYSAGTGSIAEGPNIPVGTWAPTSPTSGVGYSQSPASSPSTALDGSYHFSYNAGDHSRQESSDNRGNVRGKYSFTTKDDGKTREVVYEAGAERGFTAKGAHIPVSGATGTLRGAFHPQSSSASGLFGSTSNELSHRTSPASQELAVGSSQGDASYSYSYQTDSSSKQESSDAQGNVVGRFSYLGGDGVTRNVHYTARGNEGFIVSGENIPAGTVEASSSPFADVRSSHTKSIDVNPSNFRLQKFLPPESPRKFGYIFDTKI